MTLCTRSLGAAVLSVQISGNTRLSVEVSDGVTAIHTESHDEQTIVAQVCGDPPQHFSLGA